MGYVPAPMASRPAPSSASTRAGGGRGRVLGAPTRRREVPRAPSASVPASVRRYALAHVAPARGRIRVTRLDGPRRKLHARSMRASRAYACISWLERVQEISRPQVLRKRHALTVNGELVTGTSAARGAPQTALACAQASSTMLLEAHPPTTRTTPTFSSVARRR